MDVLPGIGIFLVALWLLFFGVLLMAVFLLSAALTQKNLAFRRRLAFHLFLGMLLPLAAGGVGISLADYRSPALRWLDRAPIGWPIALCVLIFLLGAALGVRRYRNQSICHPHEGPDSLLP